MIKIMSPKVNCHIFMDHGVYIEQHGDEPRDWWLVCWDWWAAAVSSSVLMNSARSSHH